MNFKGYIIIFLIVFLIIIILERYLRKENPLDKIEKKVVNVLQKIL